MPDTKIDFMRHTLAVIAYRGRKMLRDAPAHFADFRTSASARTPVQILAHMGDLFDWTQGLLNGRYEWHEASPLPWDEEIARFFAGLDKVDAALAARSELGYPEEKIFQGPLADALTHIGQLAMLRREAGAPIQGENYFKADMSQARATTNPRP